MRRSFASARLPGRYSVGPLYNPHELEKALRYLAKEGYTIRGEDNVHQGHREYKKPVSQDGSQDSVFIYLDEVKPTVQSGMMVFTIAPSNRTKAIMGIMGEFADAVRRGNLEEATAIANSVSPQFLQEAGRQMQLTNTTVMAYVARKEREAGFGEWLVGRVRNVLADFRIR